MLALERDNKKEEKSHPFALCTSTSRSTILQFQSQKGTFRHPCLCVCLLYLGTSWNPPGAHNMRKNGWTSVRFIAVSLGLLAFCFPYCSSWTCDRFHQQYCFLKQHFKVLDLLIYHSFFYIHDGEQGKLAYSSRSLVYWVLTDSSQSCDSKRKKNKSKCM